MLRLYFFWLFILILVVEVRNNEVDEFVVELLLVGLPFRIEF